MAGLLMCSYLVEIKEMEEEWNQGQLLTGTCPDRFGSDENA